MITSIGGIILLSLFSLVHSHGYVSSPRSRNWIAHELGTDGQERGKVKKEYCPHCLNRSNGVCGFTSTNDYDEWVDSLGNSMPWDSQGVYTSGDEIRISFTLTVHHGGHVEVRACPKGRQSTLDCFEDPSHALHFIRDVSYDIPADPNYPERGYLAGWPDGYRDFVYDFKLPNNLHGEEVLLQWRYITSNSCKPPGYDAFFNGENSQSRVLPSNWYSPNVSDCNLPYPPSGDVTSPGSPEQFFGCVEVSVSPPPPNQSPVPVNEAPLQLPVAAPGSMPTSNARAKPEDSRMIAYLGNWQSCPTSAQLQQYSHIVIAFAVSYTWSPTKNVCSQTCEISTPPICSNAPNSALIDQLHRNGKKVILSFGGAGMGGSWDSDVNDCWEYCFGREQQVVDRLKNIVEELDLDGVDIDYEYFYEDSQNGSGFRKGAQAIRFLRDVTLGLRNALPADAIVTHAPMDVDLMPGTAYYEMLRGISSSLDFLMPQYYNGVTRPVTDGFDRANAGRIVSSQHYRNLVEQMFLGDATKIVFGFCISDCAFTGSNANPTQAAAVMSALGQAFGCNGGAFFWVAEHDTGGMWSTVVNKAMDINRGCSSSTAPAPSPVASPGIPPKKTPRNDRDKDAMKLFNDQGRGELVRRRRKRILRGHS